MKAIHELKEYPLVMSAEQVGKVIGRSAKTIRRQCAAGAFPIPRLNRASGLAFRKSRVIQFLEDETTGGAL